METIAEFNLVRGKLIQLDSSILADALLTLALESSSAAMVVKRLAANTEEKITLFKSNLHMITHPPKRGRVSGQTILSMLKRTLELLDPLTIPAELGLELMEVFFCTDSIALESSTELDFEFEVLYREDAFDMFTAFALKCSNPDHVIQVLKRLLADDGYGMREKLLLEAGTYLPQSFLQKLTV